MTERTTVDHTGRLPRRMRRTLTEITWRTLGDEADKSQDRRRAGMDDAQGTLDIDMACHGPASPAITPFPLKGSLTS